MTIDETVEQLAGSVLVAQQAIRALVRLKNEVDELRAERDELLEKVEREEHRIQGYQGALAKAKKRSAAS